MAQQQATRPQIMFIIYSGLLKVSHEAALNLFAAMERKEGVARVDSPRPESRNECYPTVQKEIAAAGGEIVTGWLLDDEDDSLAAVGDHSRYNNVVRNKYRGNADFETAERFFDTLYASNRLQLPLRGVLLIGY